MNSQPCNHTSVRTTSAMRQLLNDLQTVSRLFAANNETAFQQLSCMQGRVDELLVREQRISEGSSYCQLLHRVKRLTTENSITGLFRAEYETAYLLIHGRLACDGNAGLGLTSIRTMAID